MLHDPDLTDEEADSFMDALGRITGLDLDPESDRVVVEHVDDKTVTLDKLRWYHLDGTECVAGWIGKTGECSKGNGLVTPRYAGD